MWGEDKQTEQENTPTKSLLRGLPRRDVVVHLIGKTQVGKLTVKRSLDNLIQYCLSILTKLDDLPPQNISVVIGNPPPPGGAAGSEASVVGRILLCLFDISDVDSFKEAEKLLAPFKLHSKLTRVLVGNKIDLEYWRKVEVGSGVALAQAMCCKYCEISAHTGMHVDLVVDVVLREMFFGLKEEMLSRFLEKLKKDKVQLFSIKAEDQLQSAPEKKKSSRMMLSESPTLQFSGGKWGPTKSEGGGITAPSSSSSASLPSTPQRYLPPTPPPPTLFPPPRAPSLSPPPPSHSTSISWNDGLDNFSVSSAGVELQESTISPIPLEHSSHKQGKKKKVSRRESEKQSSGGIHRSRKEETQPVLDLFSEPTPPMRASDDVEFERQKETDDAEEEAISPLQLESTIPSDPQPRPHRLAESPNDLAGLEAELEQTNSIMMKNIDQVVERSEKLERIEMAAESLQQQAGSFKKSSRNLKRMMAIARCKQYLAVIFCCPCFFTVWAWDYLKTLSKKAALFDNVLADTENAFQSLAKLLVFLREWTELTLSPCLYFVFGGLLNLLSGIISFVVVLCSTIVLILPSFFTLLIVRTSTVEKESKAFGGESH
jgi:hypothetical protein